MIMVGRTYSWHGVLAYPFAVGVGLLIAWFDLAAPFGDDTEKGTLLLWLVTCGMLGLFSPARPWRWAVLVAIWVPIIYFARNVLGLPNSLNPNSYSTILILMPVSLAVCLAGAYAGSFIRHRS
jgi:hypothetical protein